jgi:hypothetical protein
MGFEGRLMRLAESEFRRIVNKVQKGEREARRPRRRWSKPTCAW